MKKLSIYLGACMLLAGCAQSADEIAVEKSDKSGHEFSVIASRGDQSTRVTFADEQGDPSSRQLVWQDEDRIAIGFSSDEFASANTFSISDNKGATALFNGIISTLPTDGDKVAALYPFDTQASFGQDNGSININTSIAAAQDGNALGLMVATGTVNKLGTTLAFKSAAPLLGIELTNSGAIQPTLNKIEISLADMGGEWLPLAGATTVTIANDGTTSTTIDSEGATTVSIACNDKMTTDKVSKYVALAPVSSYGGTIRIVASLSNGRQVYKDIYIDALLAGHLYMTTMDIATCSDYDEENIDDPWAGIFSVECTAGGLQAAVKALQPDLDKVVEMNVVGTIDKRDFDFIRDLLPNIRTLDLTNATIAEYTDDAEEPTTYPANTVPMQAFYNRETYLAHTTLTTIVLAKSVIGVGESAFSGCTSLTNVSLPEATTIENDAFAGCTSLKELSLPKVTTLGYAFSNSGIEEIVCDVLETLQPGLFSGNTTLKSAIFPKVKTVGASVFSNCSSLIYVHLLEATTIDNGTFVYCTSLKKLSLPKVTTLRNAFGGSGVEEITCDVLETLTSGLLSGNTSLKSAIFPKAKTLGQAVFNGCTSLTNVYLPEATTIDNGTFVYCTSLKKLSLPKVTLLGNAFGGSGVEEITCDVLETLTENLLSGNTSLKSAIFPKAKTLGQNVFNGCSSLANVYLPEATTIDNGTFVYCTSLKKLSLPKVTTLGYAFGDSGVEEITCDVLETLTSGLLSGNTSLKSATFPSCKTVSASVFSGCTSLANVYLPEATKIDNSTFVYCTSLKKLSLPKVTTLGYAFGDSGVEEITCDALETLQPGLLSGNTSLKSATFPSCKTVSASVFSGCTSLANVYLPEATKIGNGTFDSCTSLIKLSLPKVTDLGYAVNNGVQELSCDALEVIIDGLLSNNAVIRKVSFPKAKSIGGGAFNSCTAMTSCTLGSTIPTLGSDAFKNNTTTVYVPAASVATYKAADGWKDLTNTITAIQ